MTTQVADSKVCLACGKPLKGRIDKKFCDDYCRNNYNNQQKAKDIFEQFIAKYNSDDLRAQAETVLAKFVASN